MTLLFGSNLTSSLVRLGHVITARSLAALILSIVLPYGTSSAQDAGANGPVYKPVPGAIVSGMSGLVTGTKDAMSTARANDRLTTIRRILTDQILALRVVDKKFSLGALDGAEYVLSNALVLCSPRGDHAVVSADATYLESVTGTLNKFSAPPKITTIGDALGTLFQNYSIEVPKDKTKKEIAKAVVDRCINDTQIWASFSYGRTLDNSASQARLLPAEIGEIGGAVSTLYSAVVAILQPIAVGAAKALDARERARIVSEFIRNNKVNLINAAQSVADKGSKLARKKRLDALSQFAEKIAALRSVQLDLSKSENCKSAVGSPVLPLPANASATPNRIPTDDFILCYAAAWKQISDMAENVVTAANQYDAFADASDDKLQLAVLQIKNNITELDNPSEAQVKAVWEAAAQLIAFGQTVSQSLSKENIEKVNKATADLMKLFNSKD